MRTTFMVVPAICLAMPGSAHATGNENRITGRYAVIGTGVCLTSPAGFDSKGQTSDPEKSGLNSLTYRGVIDYDGTGKFTGDLTVVSIRTGHSADFTPRAGSGEVQVQGTYQVSANGEVESTASGKDKSGGADVRGIAFSGILSGDNRTILASSGPGISTVVLPDGTTFQRHCSEADIEVKMTP